MRVFQLTAVEIERYGTLDQQDLGKWCFLVQGCLEGFHATREAAEAQYLEIFGR